MKDLLIGFLLGVLCVLMIGVLCELRRLNQVKQNKHKIEEVKHEKDVCFIGNRGPVFCRVQQSV